MAAEVVKPTRQLASAGTDQPGSTAANTSMGARRAAIGGRGVGNVHLGSSSRQCFSVRLDAF